MADYEVSNKLPVPDAAAAANSVPVSKDKAEEVSPPLPATHDVVVKPQRPSSAAGSRARGRENPAASCFSSVAVVPVDDDDDNNDDDETPLPGDHVLRTVSLWAMVHVVSFTVAIIVDYSTPCTPRTWLLPPCVALTHAAKAEVTALLHGELCCIIAAEWVALSLLKVLTEKSRNIRGRWADAVVQYATAWVALAFTAGIHGTQIASDLIYLAADPKEKFFFVRIILVSGCLTVDIVLAGFLHCCHRLPRRLGQGEHQGDDGEV